MNNILYIILGSVLTIAGGAVNDEIRSTQETKRERKAITISLCDELTEISTTMKNMQEVWEKSKVLYPSYVADIIASTSTYESYKTRLFLIKGEETRKSLVSFYKKMREVARRSDGKLGTLADTEESKTEQSTFAVEFKKIGEDAEALKIKLKC